MNKRNLTIDLLKSIGILLMVFDHVGFGNNVHIIIQSFHMPLFFIVSGYLYKEKDTKEYIKNTFKKLMIPYIFFSILQFILYVILNYKNTENIMKSFISIFIFPDKIFIYGLIGALWFLYCMFISKNIFNIMKKNIHNDKKLSIIVIALIILITIYKLFINLDLPLLIIQSIIAIIFMYIGYMIKKYNIVEKISKYKMLSFITVLIIYVLFVYLNIGEGHLSVDMRSGRVFNFIFYLFEATSGTLLLWIIVKKIEETFNSKFIQIISYFSKNGLAYLLFNQLLILSINKVISIFTVKNLYTQIINFVITILVITIINEILLKTKFKVLIGK